MKIKKLLAAITVSTAFVLGFTACMEGSGKYSYSYISPAVVEHNLQVGTLLRTAYGNFIPDNVSIGLRFGYSFRWRLYLHGV